MFCPGWQKWHGMFCPGQQKMAWDVLSGVTKTTWDVLSGVANRCGMFCPGCQKMAWDVLSWDVLSYILVVPLKDFLKGFDLGKITADTYEYLEAMYRVYIASSTYQKLLNYSACI